MGLSSGWRVAIQKERGKRSEKKNTTGGKKRFGVEQRRDFYQERASR